MLRTYTVSNNLLKKLEDAGTKISDNAEWIDLLEPSKEEEKAVEKFLNIQVPTREEMAEIELSNRFYEENGVLYMTASILAKAENDEADAHEITFIIANNKLVTIRYVEPQSFKTFASQAQKCPENGGAGVALLNGLLGAFINRIADITENIDSQIDVISKQIFKNDGLKQGRSNTKHFQRIIKELGLAGDLISKTQESLISIERLVTFLVPQLSETSRKVMSKRLDFVTRDSVALREHTSYLLEKINFLLDATLGLINIQQNDIMKLFSIVAVCFMPSTLVVGFFGMNFKNMPLLGWDLGYQFSIGLMLITLVASFLIFRRKGWL